MIVSTSIRRAVTRCVLTSLEGLDFALAGAGALMEHGIVERGTDDVDAFTTRRGPDVFNQARNSVQDALDEAGWNTSVTRNHPEFVVLLAENRTTGAEISIDLGVDWRAHPPVTLDVGPVLDIKDAVSAKLVALFSRRETRDVLDVDSIRRHRQFSDNALLAMATDRDPGFDRDILRATIASFTENDSRTAGRYGVSKEEWLGVLTRLSQAFSSVGRG